jgi:hypothetical protein
MTEIWIWTVWERVPDGEEAEPAPEAAEPPPDLAGYAVEATDGHIGAIDEVSYDAGSGCIIVDTGFWIFGKKRMVPAGMIEKVDTEARTVHLSCSKADVKAAPDYDPDRTDDPTHRDDVGDHYQGLRPDPT